MLKLTFVMLVSFLLNGENSRLSYVYSKDYQENWWPKMNWIPSYNAQFEFSSIYDAGYSRCVCQTYKLRVKKGEIWRCLYLLSLFVLQRQHLTDFQRMYTCQRRGLWRPKIDWLFHLIVLNPSLSQLYNDIIFVIEVVSI